MLVVGFAIEFVAFADGSPVGYFPTLIADNQFFAPICVSHFQLKEQSWGAVVHGVFQTAPFKFFLVVFVVAHRVVSAARERDPDSVVALLEHVGDIVSIEIDPLVVVGEGWFENLFGRDLLTVQIGTVLP